jgi:hypothetical protein
MKYFRRAAALTLLLLTTGCAQSLASGGLSGTYVTTVRTVSGLNGTYHISFSPGRFVIHAPYGLVGHGTDSISGSRITLHGPGRCGAAGLYSFTMSGAWLTFRKIRDSCPRVAVLTAHALRRS